MKHTVELYAKPVDISGAYEVRFRTGLKYVKPSGDSISIFAPAHLQKLSATSSNTADASSTKIMQSEARI
jgi:hypothetical protein